MKGLAYFRKKAKRGDAMEKELHNLCVPGTGSFPGK
jgi:hypothetical protein